MSTDNSTSNNQKLSGRQTDTIIAKGVYPNILEVQPPDSQKTSGATYLSMTVNATDHILHQHVKMEIELQFVKLLTRTCLTLGTIVLTGMLYLIIGPIVHLKDYPHQELALIFSISFTLYDFIKAFGTVFCAISIVAILLAKSRYKIRIRKPLGMVICSIIMIYLPSVANGIVLYYAYPDYGTYPFFCDMSHF